MILPALAGRTPGERIALECLLQRSFSHVSGGLHPGQFDMAFMVDEQPRITGAGIEMRPPDELERMLDEADLDALDRYLKDNEEALEGILLDASHGERYLTLDRIQALVFLTALGQDVIYRDENGQLVKVKKQDLAERMDELPEEFRTLVQPESARLSSANAMGIIADDAAMLHKKLGGLEENLLEQDLNRKPFEAYAKELDKRAIRIMLGFLCTTDAGLKLLNELPDRALAGEVVDHSTICDIGIEVLSRLDIPESPLAQEIAEVIRSWKNIKMGHTTADDLVRRQLAEGQSLPTPDDPDYRQNFLESAGKTMQLVDLLVEKGFRRGAGKLTPLFEQKQALTRTMQSPEFAALPEDQRQQHERRLQVVESSIALKLTGLAALHDKLGEDGETLREALKRLEAVGYEEAQFDSILGDIRARRSRATEEPQTFLLQPMPMRRSVSERLHADGWLGQTAAVPQNIRQSGASLRSAPTTRRRFHSMWLLSEGTDGNDTHTLRP